MDAKDMIQNGLDMSDRLILTYIGDLDDADLLVRPVAGMNHIAWQLGHLLDTERRFLDAIKPGSSPALPADFEAGHGRKQTDVDDPSKYYSREKYTQLWKAQREATRAVLAQTPVGDLDRKDPEKFPEFAPTVGEVFALLGTHALMHAGQFVAVRRKVGKPVTI